MKLDSCLRFKNVKLCFLVDQQVVTAVAQVFAVVRVQSLAWELLHAMGEAKKKKKKKKKNVKLRET